MKTELTQSERQSVNAFDVLDELFATAAVPGDCPEPIEILPEDLEIPTLYIVDPVEVYSMDLRVA